MGVRQISKIALVWDLIQQGVPKGRIADHLGVCRRTVIRWHQGFKQFGGLEAFLDYHLMAKKGPRAKRKVDPVLKRRVWALREKHRHCCGQKIAYHLKEEYGTNLGVTTIYRILAEKYQLRNKWKKNKKPGPVPKAKSPREVVQMDSVNFGNIFAFCAVDIFSKEADVLLRTSLEATDGQVFLHTCMKRRFDGFSDLIQTDGGSEFKADFHQDTPLYCKRHRFARAYKKNEQSYIESFNRSLRKECLGWGKYKPNQIPALTREINHWLVYYHYQRPHLGLGMRPPLKDKV